MRRESISQRVTKKIIDTIKVSVLTHFFGGDNFIYLFSQLNTFPICDTRSHLHFETCWERYKVQIAISAVNLRLDRRGLRLSLESTVNRESFPLIAERHFAKVASYNIRIAIFAFPCFSLFLDCFSIILEAAQSSGIQTITFIRKSIINVRLQ